MQFKTEPKEKFTVLTLLDQELGSNLVPELVKKLSVLSEISPKNLVVNLSQVKEWDTAIIEAFALSQEQYYDNNTSFVICCLSNKLQSQLEETDFGEIMNITLTESEAWDIVHMEEIERSLLDSDDMEFSSQD